MVTTNAERYPRTIDDLAHAEFAITTGPGCRYHLTGGWNRGTPTCGTTTTVDRVVATLDQDGGLEAIITAVVEHDILPGALCKNCFYARARAAITAQYPRRLAVLGRVSRYAIVDVVQADDTNPTLPAGAYRMQVRHIHEGRAYVVPVGKVDDTARAGDDYVGAWFPIERVAPVPA